MLSTYQDLDPGGAGTLSRRRRLVSRIRQFQRGLRYRDVERSHLPDLEPADVGAAQDWHLCYLCDRRFVSSFPFFRLSSKIVTLMCCRACIASILRLVFRVKLARTEDYSYVKFQGVLWA